MAPKTAEKAVAGKAPATKAPAAKKVVKKATNGGASKKKTKAVESYKIYIYKVLKQVQPCPLLHLSIASSLFFPSTRGGGQHLRCV